MPKLDLQAALRNLIAAQVEAALEPHRALLASLENLAREQGAVKEAPRAATRRPAGRRAARNVAAPATSFSPGQMVSYRQGRGTFEAKVIEVDLERGELKLQREKDGKRVERPFQKVMVVG